MIVKEKKTGAIMSSTSVFLSKYWKKHPEMYKEYTSGEVEYEPSVEKPSKKKKTSK